MKAYRKNIETSKAPVAPVPQQRVEPKTFTPAQDARVNFMRNILVKARPQM